MSSYQATGTSNALNAIGTLIGYIGTEVATDDFFDRLLWPCRAYNGFGWQHLLKAMLLMPMGGPLHKAALTTLDGFYKEGLYQKHQQGHMLGTAFYRDSKYKYRAYGQKDLPHANEYVRNGLWARAVMRTPLVVKPQYTKADEEHVNAESTPTEVRQKIAVGHLKLYGEVEMRNATIMIAVKDDTSRPGVRVYLALITTETTAIVVAVLVAAIWRSAFAAFWLLPLALKIVSTIFTMERESLDEASSAAKTSKVTRDSGEVEDVKVYSIRNPSGGFVVIEGKDEVVLPFFRHYGHPRRSKPLENLQIAIVVSFTLLFPLGLVCSTLWMTDTLQKVWVGYQLYATLAMYVYRYAGGHMWCTTEEQLGKCFIKLEMANDGSRVVALKGAKGVVVGATLERQYFNRYGEAKAGVEKLIEEHQLKTSAGKSTLATNNSWSSLSSRETMCQSSEALEAGSI